jgi:hypothetical protein
LPAAEAINHICVFLLGTGEHRRSRANGSPVLTLGFKYRSQMDTALLFTFSGRVKASNYSACSSSVILFPPLVTTLIIYCSTSERVTGCQTTNPRRYFVCAGTLYLNPLPPKRRSRLRGSPHRA